MKRILIIFVLLMLPMVLAGTENGDITSGGDLLITDVDVKVDTLTRRNLE